jgi:hypothetical protein
MSVRLCKQLDQAWEAGSVMSMCATALGIDRYGGHCISYAGKQVNDDHPRFKDLRIWTSSQIWSNSRGIQQIVIEFAGYVRGRLLEPSAYLVEQSP